MLDQLRQMAIFAKTVDHGSFRAAARSLRLSPSVLSHHVSQLEQSLSIELVDIGAIEFVTSSECAVDTELQSDVVRELITCADA